MAKKEFEQCLASDPSHPQAPQYLKQIEEEAAAAAVIDFQADVTEEQVDHIGLGDALDLQVDLADEPGLGFAPTVGSLPGGGTLAPTVMPEQQDLEALDALGLSGLAPDAGRELPPAPAIGSDWEPEAPGVA